MIKACCVWGTDEEGGAVAGPGIAHEAQDRPHWETMTLPSPTGTL